MRKLSLVLGLTTGIFANQALADFTAKDASAVTMTFKNPATCTSVVCTPIAAIFDPTGTNGAAVDTAGADAVSNTKNGLSIYGRNLVFNGTTWDRWQGVVTVTGVSTAANQTSELTKLDTLITNSAAPIPAGTANIGNVGQISQYPTGAVPITASATGTTAATTATLAGTSGKTTYICSYSIRANATAATTVLNTITGVVTATMSHQMWVAPAASGIGLDEQIFNPCVPASATNTAIAVVSGAPGAGGLVSATATGYQL